MLLESKETFCVYVQEASTDDVFRPFGVALHSIEAVRKRLSRLQEIYPKCKCKVTRTTFIVEEINPTTFNA